MATVHGVEGTWLQALTSERDAHLKQYGAVLAGGVIVMAMVDVRLAALVLAAGIGLAASTRSRVAQFQQAKRGAEAELETSRMLALLPAGFTVLTDAALRRYNVDHVVVGPSGVWAVETQARGGTFKEGEGGVSCEGRALSADPRCGVRAGATGLAELLQRETGARWWVEPLVCMPNARVVSGAGREASIVGAGQILTRLRLAPVRLAPEQRETIVAALARLR